MYGTHVSPLRNLREAGNLAIPKLWVGLLGRGFKVDTCTDMPAEQLALIKRLGGAATL